MKEYLLKQPKATCVLFSIACKINLGIINNNGNLGRRGGLWPWKSGWEGGSKNLAIRRGGVDFFWNNSYPFFFSFPRDSHFPAPLLSLFM